MSIPSTTSSVSVFAMIAGQEIVSVTIIATANIAALTFVVFVFVYSYVIIIAL